ncbi:hypothetical protein [Ureibacillus sp. FSL W8-0352]|uniref:hypothetical protein n=1 Tax=Ureibacillus sp. FSL W8-0352 TaxID=2954596 RepID=UPI0030F9A72E
MTTIIIILLIISQLISFFLIFILNAKIAKFKDLELRQDKLMEEMENAISVYLLEVKEENERFIDELIKLSKPQSNESYNMANEQINKQISDHINKDSVQLKNEENNGNPKIEKLQVIPKAVAKNAYIQQQKSHTSNREKVNEEAVNEEKQQKLTETNLQMTSPTLKEKIVALHQEGKSIEEIAKITQKGKTEIELLLKFNS